MATPPARHLHSRRRIRRRSVHATTIKDLEVTRLEKKRPEVTAFHSLYIMTVSFSYVLEYQFPTWLVWGGNQVYSAYCSAKTALV